MNYKIKKFIIEFILTKLVETMAADKEVGASKEKKSDTEDLVCDQLLICRIQISSRLLTIFIDSRRFTKERRYCINCRTNKRSRIRYTKKCYWSFKRRSTKFKNVRVHQFLSTKNIFIFSLFTYTSSIVLFHQFQKV